jgi:hypothetical protein
MFRPPAIDVICDDTLRPPAQRDLLARDGLHRQAPANVPSGADHRPRLPVSLIPRGGMAQQSQRVRLPPGGAMPSRAASAGPPPLPPADLSDSRRIWRPPTLGHGVANARLGDLRITNLAAVAAAIDARDAAAAAQPPPPQRMPMPGAEPAAAANPLPPARARDGQPPARAAATKAPREALWRPESRAAAAAAAAAATAGLGVGGAGLGGSRLPVAAAALRGPDLRHDSLRGGGGDAPRRGGGARGWSAPARRGGRG